MLKISVKSVLNDTFGMNSKPLRKQRKAPVGGKWSEEEDTILCSIVDELGPKNWKKVNVFFQNCISKSTNELTQYFHFRYQKP